MSDIDKILEADKNKQAVFGTNQTIKLLKNHALSEIYLSANFPADTEAVMAALAKEAKTKLNKLENTNEELGTLCKKPFKVAIIGILSKE